MLLVTATTNCFYHWCPGGVVPLALVQRDTCLLWQDYLQPRFFFYLASKTGFVISSSSFLIMLRAALDVAFTKLYSDETFTWRSTVLTDDWLTADVRSSPDLHLHNPGVEQHFILPANTINILLVERAEVTLSKISLKPSARVTLHWCRKYLVYSSAEIQSCRRRYLFGYNGRGNAASVTCNSSPH